MSSTPVTAPALIWMPILRHPIAVRVALLNEQQAMKNHGQTLARLAERGGLSLSEAAAIAIRQPWRSMSNDEALELLQRMGQRQGIY